MSKLAKGQFITKHKQPQFETVVNHHQYDKQNILLPALSIKQIKPSRRLIKNKFLISNISKMKLMSQNKKDVVLKTKKLINTIQMSKISQKPKSSFLFNKFQHIYNQIKNKKTIFLPPFESCSSQSSSNSHAKSYISQYQHKDKTINKNKPRANTNCKILMQKNSNFPFYIKRKLLKNQKRQINNQEDIYQFSIFSSKISKIQLKEEPEQFISRGSIQQIVIF